MNETKQPAQSREDTVTLSKFWGTIAMAGIAMLVFGYFLTFILRLDKTPVIYIAMAVFLFALMASMASIVLTIRGRQELGVKLTFYTLFIVGITIISFIQGRAQTASLSILVISIIAILYLLPRQSWRWYTSVAVVATIVMWTIEWLNPSWRVQISAAKVGPAAVTVFALILGWIAFTQSRKFLSVSIATSLRLQITVWTGDNTLLAG